MSEANFRGFISNAHDTKIMSSYVDENFRNGLKENSKALLNYDQQSYKDVTSMTGPIQDLPKGGKIIVDEHRIDIDALRELDQKKLKKRLEKLGFEDMHEAIESQTNRVVTKQYRMNELTAEHVLAYGADDTICTAALYNYYQTIMEIEKTMHVFEQVEIKPAYMTALAYTQGVPVSIERLKQIEREDDVEALHRV
jgi:hypothetical protein